MDDKKGTYLRDSLDRRDRGMKLDDSLNMNSIKFVERDKVFFKSL